MLKLAAIAVTGACLATIPSYAQDQQDRTQNPQQQQQGDRIGQPGAHQQDLPPGIRWDAEPAEPGDFRGVIDDIVGAAVIENGFNDVVERFVDQDRNRFGEWMDQGENREFTEFNAAAKRFQDAYKAKFGGEFDFDADTALSGIMAKRGEVEDPTAVAAHWPVKPFGGAAGGMEPAPGDARVAGGEMGDDAQQQRDPTNKEGNLEEGREVAIVMIPAPMPGATGARAGAPDAQAKAGGADAQPAAAKPMARQGKVMRISLINEMPGAWKVDVPNDRQPQQVYTDLAKRIDRCTQMSAQWPSDEAAVQQVIAFEVMSAIYGVDAPGKATSEGKSAHQKSPQADQAADDRPGSGGN